MKLHALTGAMLLMSGIAGTARADFRICNHSGVTTRFAVTELKDGAYVSHGWWSIGANGACATVLRGSLTERNYFVYGYDGEGMEVSGDEQFCVMKPRSFNILNADRDCDGPSREWRNFLAVDTDSETNFTFDVYDYTLTPAAH